MPIIHAPATHVGTRADKFNPHETKELTMKPTINPEPLTLKEVFDLLFVALGHCTLRQAETQFDEGYETAVRDILSDLTARRVPGEPLY